MPSNNSPAQTWQLKKARLEFGGLPKIMGIVNVTPDSFSDGGKFLDHSAAVAHALKLVEDGADILDIGGESTRPYSDSVSEEDELKRVLPVIKEIAGRTDTPVSIDTSKAAVARSALDAGAQIINDVTALTGDPNMINVAIEFEAGVCAMHMQGNPQSMQDNPSYKNVAADVFEYLKQRRDLLIESGIQAERICLDPGIGFGKTHEHNFQLIRQCEQFLELGHPILIGHSRKGFIGKAIGDKTANRDFGTLAITTLLAQKGIQIVRVHNVASTFSGFKVLEQTLEQPEIRSKPNDDKCVFD